MVSVGRRTAASALVLASALGWACAESSRQLSEPAETRTSAEPGTQGQTDDVAPLEPPPWPESTSSAVDSSSDPSGAVDYPVVTLQVEPSPTSTTVAPPPTTTWGPDAGSVRSQSCELPAGIELDAPESHEFLMEIGEPLQCKFVVRAGQPFVMATMPLDGLPISVLVEHFPTRNGMPLEDVLTTLASYYGHTAPIVAGESLESQSSDRLRMTETLVPAEDVGGPTRVVEYVGRVAASNGLDMARDGDIVTGWLVQLHRGEIVSIGVNYFDRPLEFDFVDEIDTISPDVVAGRSIALSVRYAIA